MTFHDVPINFQSVLQLSSNFFDLFQQVKDSYGKDQPIQYVGLFKTSPGTWLLGVEY